MTSLRSRAARGRDRPPVRREPVRPAGPPALIFDGECPFCTASALWARRRLRRPVELLPWQALAERGRLGPFGLTEEETKRSAWWVENGRRWRGHRAAGRALLACRGAWPLAGRVLLAPPPLSWVFALGYSVVSHLRKHLRGVRPACQREQWPPPPSRPRVDRAESLGSRHDVCDPIGSSSQRGGPPEGGPVPAK